ncbi:MAG TPA: tyrosine-type recombinase/integrase [Prolixibacteraceae bacterium]|nr:tyrosine-type recombinase/integrase [Prolixibacteraceae bacterium]
MNKTSDYIEYDSALNTGFKLLGDSKKCVIGFYIVFSINSGLRISDVLNITHSQLSDDKIIIIEKKTKKQRVITVNEIVKKAYGKLVSKLNELEIKFNDEDYIFISQKNTVFKTQSINALLKTIFNNKRIQVSSHSLRKSFARKVYENMNESENALVLLSDIFSHSSIAITRRYLGIRQETISNVYLALA